MTRIRDRIVDFRMGIKWHMIAVSTYTLHELMIMWHVVCPCVKNKTTKSVSKNGH